MSKALRLTTLAAVVFASGCGDALVGGKCAAGYLPDGDACLPAPELAGGVISGGGDGGDGAGGWAFGGSGATTSAGGSTSGGAGGFGGALICRPPLESCNGECVDISMDPANCGACGIVCDTGICKKGKCVGDVVGHAIVVGMDFKSASFGAPASVLLGNAVFMTPHEPARILEYREYALTPAVANVTAIVADEGKKRGRSSTKTVATNALSVPALLASKTFDVFLVQDEPNAPPEKLGSVGAAWHDAIKAFADGGGVIVALATDTGTNQMPGLLSTAGVLTTTGLSDVTGQALTNNAWLDAVGVNVVSPFLARQHSASLSTSEGQGANLAYVIVTETGAPVVIHRLAGGS